MIYDKALKALEAAMAVANLLGDHSIDKPPNILLTSISRHDLLGYDTRIEDKYVIGRLYETDEDIVEYYSLNNALVEDLSIPELATVLRTLFLVPPSNKLVEFSSTDPLAKRIINLAVYPVLRITERDEEEELLPTGKETGASPYRIPVVVDSYVANPKLPMNKYLVSTEDKTKKFYNIDELGSILGSVGNRGTERIPTTRPTRRFHRRNVLLDRDNCYLKEVVGEGDNIDVVLLIDRSGSMWGTPVKDSNLLALAMNNLALKMPDSNLTVIYTDCRSSVLVELPIENGSSLLDMTRLFNAEGIAESLDEHIERVSKADAVFIYTDGDIVSKPVKKDKFSAMDITLVGLFTTTPDKLTPEKINEHYSTNKPWFHHVLVDTSLKNLAERMLEYISI